MAAHLTKEALCALRRGLRTMGEVALETLWTTRCAACDQPGELLCEQCAAALRYVDQTLCCPRCGAPFGAIQCTECNPYLLAQAGLSTFPLDGLRSAVVLDDASHRMVTSYKDRDELRLAPLIGRLLAQAMPPEWVKAQGAAIAFVPSSARARARRGFDHCLLLAQAVSDQVRLPVLDCLEPPCSADQRALGRAGRLENMRKGMRARPGAARGRAIVVVDDVCTTGATLYAAADALRQQGAYQVYGLTFARALS